MPFRAAACTGALFHIELYLVCADLPDLEAGVYHYGAHDNGLRQLRRGDFRQCLGVAAPLAIVLTSTWWRNAWKYQERTYRHAFWDSGTILANLLSVANATALPSKVLVGFPDRRVNALLDVEPQHEAAVAIVSVGLDGPAPPTAPDVQPLDLPTRPLSTQEVAYPEIVSAHTASSLPSAEAVADWRAAFSPLAAATLMQATSGQSIEQVILRRGSSRRFTHDPLPRAVLQSLLVVATSPYATDAPVPTDLYLIVNAAEDEDERVAPGAYVWNRATQQLELLRAGDFRREAAFLDLGQSLAGDAALNAYWLVDIDRLDDRGYRAAQLSAAIEAGKLYLAAYSLGLGATGLTFFDDDVTAFFSPHAAGKSVMFLTAVGRPARKTPA
jgi:SagB-type dehydrogenase family enzyme